MAVLKDLIVHGPSKFIGKTYVDTLEANSVQANEGLFTKLAAKSASANELTVSGLLDVHGELHTKSWSNSNIATVDGNLHIVPTVTAATAKGTIRYSSSVYSMSLVGAFDTSTLTIGTDTNTVNWTSGSSLIVSGEVQIGNEWLPLGTLTCDLGGSVPKDDTSKTVPLASIKDSNRNTPEVLESIRATLNFSDTSGELNFRNVKIAFYSRKNTKMYPIGILLTAQGTGASKTFVDMYDGNHEASSTYGGLAEPVVRIGNLSSSNLAKVGNQTPAGWGIYTSNGYFSGAIAAKQGYIGDGAMAWTIGNDGDKRAYIFSGITNITTSGSTTGIYVGTNGISNYQSATQYVNISSGKITAQGADIAGKITANSGYIGGTSGWTIASQQLSNGTIGSNNSLFMGTKNLGSNTSIAGRAGSDWRLTVGSGFGVTNTGTLYATGAHIGGAITATSGKIGGFDIVNGVLQVSSIIKDSTHKAVISGEGMKIYSGDTTNEVALFSATARIGAKVASSSYLTLESNKMALVGTNSSNTPSEIFIVGNLLNTTTLDSFIGNGSTKKFQLSTNYPTGDPQDLVVKVNNVTKTKGTDYTHVYENSKSYISFTTAPAADADIAVTYTKTISTPYMTFVSRKSGTENKAGSFVFGSNCEASGNYSHAFGANSSATTYGASADGYRVTASGEYSHAEGSYTSASGDYSHAEGYHTSASGDYSHAEGRGATASGNFSHAQGYGTTASGTHSHAEGQFTTASRPESHAEGFNTTASGTSSHAEGSYTTADGIYSHAEGFYTTASGKYSHASGYETIARGQCQTAIGEYNVAQGIINSNIDSDHAFIIGNGTADNARSNAFTVNWNGDVDIPSPSSGGYKKHGKSIFAFKSVTSAATTINASKTTRIEATFTLEDPYTQVIGVRQISTNHNEATVISGFGVNGDGAVGNTVTLFADCRSMGNKITDETVTFEVMLVAM